jgi:hypothetical protein
VRAARAAALAPAVALALAAVAGCTGSAARTTTAPTAPPPDGTGYFVGSGPHGVGASLDLEGDDPVIRAIERALISLGTARGARVGIASVVDDGPLAVPAPRFVARFEGGGALPFDSATEAIGPGRTPAARLARRMLAAVPRRIPAGGAGTVYVVLRGAAVEDVSSVVMVAVPGAPVTLTPRRR